jgi:hypothetical protein
MPVFQASVALYDGLGRTINKSYELDTTDFATAQTEVAAMVDDLQAITESEVLSYTVAQRTAYSGTSPVGSNFDEGATISLRKTDNFKAVHRIPAPTQALRQAGTDAVDTTDADLIAYFGNWISGNFLMSDGEQIAAVLSGKMDR